MLRKWSIHDFTDKNCNIFSIKVKKLDEEVIDIGREFQILVPSVVCKCQPKKISCEYRQNIQIFRCIKTSIFLTCKV